MNNAIAAIAALFAVTAQAQTDETLTRQATETVAYLECAELTLDQDKMLAFQIHALATGRPVIAYRLSHARMPPGTPLSTILLFDIVQGPTAEFRLGQMSKSIREGLSLENQREMKLEWSVFMNAAYKRRNCDLPAK